nr:RNA-directed DNA polymerase, eukaryota, nucleotide-binding alpha-beta plait domain protein [Tanacetum cinerariifolium]
MFLSLIMSDRNFHNSYVNQTQKISKSVFVTNFPEDSTARDLWKVCSDYGTVIDGFIQFKRPKSGKRFAFVRFIKKVFKTSSFHILEGCGFSEFDSLASKEKFLNHSGIGSWFTELIQATSSFKNDERIIWISIEGLLIKAWTPNTFCKIASLWEIINKRQKVIIQGKVYWIRVKELDAWFPNFQEDDQDDLSSNGESQEGDVANKAGNNESDVDRVSESSFMHENDTAHKDVNSRKKGEVGSHSEDPFNIYGILDGQKNNVCNSCSDEPKFPPGFTPDNNDQEKSGRKYERYY